MPDITDYGDTSRQRTDSGFRIYTRRRVTFGSINLMPTPVRSSQDQSVVVSERFQYRWDLLANEYLNDVSLKWVLMRHNRVENPFYSPRPGQTILIPTSEQVQYYLGESLPQGV